MKTFIKLCCGLVITPVWAGTLIPLFLPQPTPFEFVEVHYFGHPGAQEPIFIEMGERVWTIQEQDFVLLGASGLPLPTLVSDRSHAWVKLVFEDGSSSGPLDIFPRKDAIDLAENPQQMKANLVGSLNGLDAGHLSELVNYLAGNNATMDVNANSYEVNGTTVINSSGDWVGGLPIDIENRLSQLESDMAGVQAVTDVFNVNGTDLILTGMNLHIRSGSGATDGAVNGLGNLIIGYNEPSPTLPDHSGSHNLVLGLEHRYSSYGSFISGLGNRVSNAHSTVVGGQNNRATGPFSLIGGSNNSTASGSHAAILGGSDLIANQPYSLAAGGQGNQATGQYATAVGGNVSHASGQYAGIFGGYSNQASGTRSVVSGGQQNTASGSASSVTGGQHNTASGSHATVSGGNSRSANGNHNWVGGGESSTGKRGEN